METKITAYIEKLDTNTISENRREILKPLLSFIQMQVDTHAAIRLIFICTHNSRRSHLTQIWAQTLANYYLLKNINCYSSGTEATALYLKVAETLKDIGFTIQMLSEGKNPIYSIKFAANEAPIIGFSKELNSPFNPKSEFAAIMTCSQANESCPFIAGASVRIPLPYNDPKQFDETQQQTEKYQETSNQIATELKYVFAQVKMK